MKEEKDFERSLEEPKFTAPLKNRLQGPLRDRLQGKKSNAKRIGVKSALAHGDNRLAITKCGQGNSAEIVFDEPNGGRDVVTPKPLEKAPFTIDYINEEIGFSGGYDSNELEAMLHNPTEKRDQDRLKLKPTIEMEIFGREFPGSTVHIQLAHNILDIQKILGLYINDVLFAINNLQASEFKLGCIKYDGAKDQVIKEPENLYKRINNIDDILGQTLDDDNEDDNTRKKQIKKLKGILFKLRPYLGFFGDAFKTYPKIENANDNKQQGKTENQGEELTDIDNHNLDVLRVLSALRHWAAHWGVNEFTQMDRNEEYPFFNINKTGDELLLGTKGKWNIVEDNYKTKINRINKDFLKNSKLNIQILCQLLNLHDEPEKKALIQDYYYFSILKQGKNLGVNITKLRENIIKQFHSELLDKVCDPHRQKINTITDYVIYRKLKASPEMVVQTVNRLQYSANEEQKNLVYKNLAISLWTQLKGILESFFKEVHCKSPRCVCDKYAKKIDKKLVDDIMLKSNDGIPFVKLMSFMCNFLEGKEINELLTAYIHKFENIQSFIDIIVQFGEPVEFVETYCAFNSLDNQFAKKVASQLRILASIGKMKPDLTDAKKPLYFAAVHTLGATDEQAEEFIEKYVLPNKSREDYETEEDYEKIKKSANPFRNFIANNVIESRQFQYLVRYSKPKIVRALMNNATIVRYALSRLPEKQIDSYYEQTPRVHKHAKRDEKLDVLTQTITGMTFETVSDNRNNIAEKSQKLQEIKELSGEIKSAENQIKQSKASVKQLKEDINNKKNQIKQSKSQVNKLEEKIEPLKAQVNLYLTVAYVAIKQLVKINARYYIAYQIFERDLQLMQTKVDDESTKRVSKHFIPYMHKDDKGNDKEDFVKHFGLIRYFLEQDENLFNEIGQWKSPDKATWYAHLNEMKKMRHFSPKCKEYLEREVNESLEISDTGFLPVAVRNITEHLILLMLIQDYVGSFHKNASSGPMTSYFELYHFLMQSLLHQVEGLKLDKYSKDNQNGVVDTRLVHIAYVPLGYNLARYKNLTIEALFDEDGVKGQNFVANKCYKQTFNRIATAKRRGKPDNVIEALKKDFIDQYGSEEEAQKAVRLGELWGYQDEARECGLKGKPFPEMVIRMMKFRKFTEAEISEVKRLYEVAKRKAPQNQ